MERLLQDVLIALLGRAVVYWGSWQTTLSEW